MYVIQRADGKFYWQHQHFHSYYGYDSFDKAHLFEFKRRAEFKIGECGDEQKCKVKQVKVVLVD